MIAVERLLARVAEDPSVAPSVLATFADHITAVEAELAASRTQTRYATTHLDVTMAEELRVWASRLSQPAADNSAWRHRCALADRVCAIADGIEAAIRSTPYAETDGRAVYVAAPYPAKAKAQSIALLLRDRGYTVTSQWLQDSQEDSPAAAQMDLNDIVKADTLLLLHEPDWANSGTGGRHVEFGFALALGKRLVVLGDTPGNVFHLLPQVARITALDEVFPVRAGALAEWTA